MELEVKYFLVLNGLIIGVIVLSIYLRFLRKPGPTKLDMRAGRAGTNTMVVSDGAGIRDLNARFEFAGQNYDAYQVLDVPAGCSAQTALENYHDLRSSLSGTQRDLIDRAFMEIRKRE